MAVLGLGRPVVYDCPVVNVKVSGRARTRCDPVGMAKLLQKFLDSTYQAHVYLEQVNAHPEQGVSSMFTFGQGFGYWGGILAVYAMLFGLPHTLVTPQRWKKTTMAGMSKEKDASRVRVVQLWPDMHGQLGAKTRGRADALLIAEHGRRELGW